MYRELSLLACMAQNAESTPLSDAATGVLFSPDIMRQVFSQLGHQPCSTSALVCKNWQYWWLETLVVRRIVRPGAIHEIDLIDFKNNPRGMAAIADSLYILEEDCDHREPDMLHVVDVGMSRLRQLSVDRIVPENDAVYFAIAADSASVYLGGQDFDGQASLVRLLSGACTVAARASISTSHMTCVHHLGLDHGTLFALRATNDHPDELLALDHATLEVRFVVGPDVLGPTCTEAGRTGRTVSCLAACNYRVFVCNAVDKSLRMLSHTGVPLETLTLDWGLPEVLCATASRVYLLNDDRRIWILTTDGAHTEVGDAAGVGELNGTARSKEGMMQLAYTYRLPSGANLDDELQEPRIACMCFFDDSLIVADYEHGKLHTIRGC